MEPLAQLRFAGPAESVQHRSGQLAKQALDDIEPRTMCWRKDKLEPLRLGGQVALRFFGDMCRMIIQQQTNDLGFGIGVIHLLEELPKVFALMRLPDQFRDFSRV